MLFSVGLLPAVPISAEPLRLSGMVLIPHNFELTIITIFFQDSLSFLKAV